MVVMLRRRRCGVSAPSLPLKHDVYGHPPHRQRPQRSQHGSGSLVMPPAARAEVTRELEGGQDFVAGRAEGGRLYMTWSRLPASPRRIEAPG